MIELKNVSKFYEKDDKVIDNLNLKINDGEIFGFIGLNGAGKTTTIKMMTGILDIDKGDIFIDGNSIKNNTIKAKRNIGFVSDNPDIFLNYKGIDYLNFIADAYNVETKERVNLIKKLSDKFDLQEELDNKIESYSHGMRQKIQIIGALLHKPQNWILDEPLTGLDPKSVYDLKSLMKEYASLKKTVFFSTHILDVAEKLCDRIGIINKGQLIFVGTLDEMKNKYGENMSLEEMFIEVTK